LLERGLEESLAEPKVPGPGHTALSPELEDRKSKIENRTARYFGDYELLEEIARGGMGVVYRARHLKLERVVAVKMILAGQFASKQIIQRFRGEVTAAALLQHPNIVAIHDVGIHDGQHYFSMDYVEGQSLSQLVGNRPLPSAKAARYVKLVAEAIHYAHQQGILHRDLKPSNVLVDASDQPRITDFGLAKRFGVPPLASAKPPAQPGSGGQASGPAKAGTPNEPAEAGTPYMESFTLTGQMLGSPNFMPPEQASSQRGKVGRHSDVYGLGAILYYLLTARPPFQAESFESVIHQLLNTEPVSPRLLNPSVPPDLETICVKCLQKEPARRYQSAQELADELGRFLSGKPIHARPIAPLERFWRWCWRNPKTAIPSAAVILLLIIVAIGSTLAAIRINRAERAATEKLFDSYLAQAREVRHNGREGQRFESLEAVLKAAAIRSSPALRSEAIACLAVTDVRFSGARESPDPEAECWDPDLELRALRKPDGSVRVRRLRDNSEVALLPALGAAAQRYCFSPGGHYLAVSYANGRNVIWDIHEQQAPIIDIPGGTSADFSVDGQTVAFICQDGLLQRFGLNPVRPLPSLVLNSRYYVIHLRPQGDWLAGFEEEKADLEVRDLRDGSLLRTLSHPSHLTSFAWSSDGAHLAVGCENGQLFIWNALTGEKQKELEGHQDAVVSVGFSHSGSLLGSNSWDGRFRLWDMLTGRVLLTAVGWSYQVLFSADDRKIGSVQRGRETGLLEITPSSIFHRLNCKASPNRGSFSTDVSSDGRLVAAAFSEGVHIWADQQTDEPFFLPAGVCFSAIFTPDGTNLITSGPSGLARWPLRRMSGTTRDELRIGPRQTIQEGHDFNYAALSTDGRWLAAADFGAGAVSIYEVRDPTNQFSLVFQPRITFPAISPDGRWVAAGNWKGSGIKVWEFESKRVVFDLPTPAYAWVAFSPDNRWLAVGGASYDLWETGSWKRKYTVHRLSPGAATPLAFSPDKRTLAIVVEPGIIRLITTETGEMLANLEAPGAALISYLSFSPDGSLLLALELDQQVEVWDLGRIRAELRKLNLDWNAPPISAETASARPVTKPLHIVMDERPP